MLRPCLAGRARVGETVGITGLGVDGRRGDEGPEVAWIAAGLGGAVNSAR